MTTYLVEFELRCSDWRRGKAKDIATEFEDAHADGGFDDSVFVTEEIEVPQDTLPDDFQAYRRGRNKVEARIEAEGWGARVVGVEMEEVEREVPEPIEDPTIADAKNWVEFDGDEIDWIHEPTNQTLDVQSSDSHHGDWEVQHKFTRIGVYETEDDAVEAALEWMVCNPYGLDPANSYM